MPIISVVVPAYNVEKYLKKCIKSLLNQTFQDFEILLIDDGSKDSTPVLCDKLALTDSRIKVYHKKNGGLSDARNYGLDRIRGKYVTFIDSDDFVSKFYLEELYKLITNKNVQISMLAFQILRENEKPTYNENISRTILTSEKAIKKMFLRQGASHSSCGKLFISELWKDIRFPVGQNYEDYATTYHVFSNAKYIGYSDAKLYYYIQHENSIMHQKCSEKTLSVLDISDNVTDFIKKTLPNARIEAMDLQASTYMDNMWAILKCKKEDEKKLASYKIRIKNKIKSIAPELLFSKRVPLKDKVKIILLLINEKLFLVFWIIIHEIKRWLYE